MNFSKIDISIPDRIRTLLRNGVEREKISFSDDSAELRGIRKHIHVYFEIRFLFSCGADGSIDYSAEGLRSIRFVMPGELHCGVVEKDISGCVSILLSAETLVYCVGGKTVTAFDAPQGLKQYGVDLDILLKMFQEYCRESRRDLEHLTICLAAMMSALRNFFSGGGLEKFRSADVEEQICIFIHNNYHRDISLEDIAASVNLSVNYVQKRFRARYGCTVSEYLIRYRLQMARRLLRQKKYRIKEIAALCGWNSANYFTNTYRKYYGVSPLHDALESGNGEIFSASSR